MSDFCSLLRRDAKITPAVLTDKQLRSVFAKELDVDKTGRVSIDEFSDWITCGAADVDGRAQRRRRAAAAWAAQYDSEQPGYGKVAALARGKSTAYGNVAGSGYGQGQADPRAYSSPAQRRMSVSQGGMVVPANDAQTATRHLRESKSILGPRPARSPRRAAAAVASPQTSPLTPRRSERRRRATRLGLESPARVLMSKVRAAAYRPGGPDFRLLFRLRSTASSGMLIDATAFVSMMRHDAKVAPAVLTDTQLRTVFTKELDTDKVGAVSEGAFLRWLEATDAVPPQASPQAAAAAVSADQKVEHRREDPAATTAAVVAATAAYATYSTEVELGDPPRARTRGASLMEPLQQSSDDLLASLESKLAGISSEFGLII